MTQRIFGLEVVACTDPHDHDWHSDGTTFCAGLPAFAGQPSEVPAVVARAPIGMVATAGADIQCGMTVRVEVDPATGRTTVVPWAP